MLRVGTCLYLYLRYVIPFRELIIPSIDPKGLKDDVFLFSNGKGGCWQTAIQTKAMLDFSTRWASFHCTTQKLRHIAKALDREFIRGDSVEDGRDDPEDTVTE